MSPFRALVKNTIDSENRVVALHSSHNRSRNQSERQRLSSCLSAWLDFENAKLLWLVPGEMPRLEDFVFNIRSILPLEFGPAHLPTTEYIRCTLTPLTKHPVVSYVDCFPEDGDSHCHFYIHFSCGWHKHVHRWKPWVWSIQQSCDEHECAPIVRYPSLRGINFLADHDDDT